tara:strand:+ start:5930 stop:7960 length:2031 start_codon:yes stop_codon:yes gene_type:complete
MARKQLGSGLFYTRDSGGKHETTPGEYVKWARRRATELNVTFNPTVSDIESMIQNEEAIRGDLYLDYEVAGDELSRVGLDALLARAVRDEKVSHVFIPRRDRLARPTDAIDAVKMENVLRQNGLTIVFMERSLSPIRTGRRPDTAEQITALLDYDAAGKHGRDLSDKMVHCQIALATGGFSTGGRPPFAFDRWLVRRDGERVRQLQDGEIMRMAGHHVVWLPAEDERLSLALRIRDLLLTTPATQIARILNAEEIPSPDAGRFRKDNGVRHEVSGLWHAPTIVNIGRNPLLAAIVRYGLRSMGKFNRFTADGPRELTDADIRADGKPRVIRNRDDEHIFSQALFEPVVSLEDHESLIRVLDKRAGTQRGKPRSRDPERNPLGARVFDMNCTWPMYRVKQGKSFRYKCGLYQQSHGQKCNHNHVDGPTATQFVLSSIQQQLLSPALLPKLKTKLHELAERDKDNDAGSSVVKEIQRIRSEISQIAIKIERAENNLALADDEDEYRAVSDVFKKLRLQKNSLEQSLAIAEAESNRSVDSDSDIDEVIDAAEYLTELAASDDGLASATELFEATNTRVFLAFQKVRQGKRELNRLKRGIVVFGNAEDPIEKYSGPTTPAKVKRKSPVGLKNKKPPKTTNSGEEAKSLRNANREFRRPIELFVAAVAELEAHVTHLVLAA